MTDWTERVLALEPVWSRAPSAHNTQPWLLRAADGMGGARLELAWEPDRELVVADPTRRDLWLSLGAVAEAIVIATRGAGIGLVVEWDVDSATRRAAWLTRDSAGSHSRGAIFDAGDLRSRRTARGPYAPARPGPGDVEAIARAADLGADGLELTSVPRPVVDRLLPAADAWSYASSAQVAELRRWLRLSPGHPAYDEDGLTDRALALNRIQARALGLALAPTTWRVLERLGGPSLLARSGRIDPRGAVIALHGPAGELDSPPAIAQAGRALLRAWLAAGRGGWHCHPLSQLIDAPGPAGALHAWADTIADDPAPPRRILSVFRLGQPLRAPAESARRPSARC